MFFLDSRTVIFSYVISDLICVIVIALLWLQNRKRFRGLGFWFISFLMQASAVVLVLLRGILPDLLSMTGSNTLILGGIILGYIGAEHFTNQPSRWFYNFIWLAAFSILHAYFVLVFPSLSARNILFSLGLLAICSQAAWLMLRRVEPKTYTFTRGVGYVFVGVCLVSVLRIILSLIIPPGDDFFNPNIFEAVLLITYQMFFIICTFSLTLMVSLRLLNELESDVAKHKDTEEALLESEERYRTIIENSVMGIALRQDDRLVLVNQAFCEMIGYSKEDLLNASGEQLLALIHPEDHQILSQRQLDRNAGKEVPPRYEYRYHHKNGQLVWMDVLSHNVTFGGRLSQIGMYLDITARKRAEEILHLQLRLWEYGASHSVNELMQTALDEIEVLTNSSISFYHFVEEDQNSLSLRAWSTRTTAEFCMTAGQDRHYPINEAGIWVDCVYQRKPVIHNDYESLPHRKGMPEGHAKVIRELVVPTIRKGQIVSILGIGNKPTYYDEQDVVLVSYIADIIWTIVEQKRAVEQIQYLNSQLELQAMTDELTGLPNRRLFFSRGPEEIKRAERYHPSLSLIMMDIDEFKLINDSFGHEAGDLVLRGVAQILKSNIREVDMAARLGGEEFCILLPNTDAEDAAKLAERLRSRIESTVYSFYEHPINVTVSIGVTDHKPLSNLDDLLRKADAAMYQAKREGRNRVVLVD